MGNTSTTGASYHLPDNVTYDDAVDPDFSHAVGFGLAQDEQVPTWLALAKYTAWFTFSQVVTLIVYMVVHSYLYTPVGQIRIPLGLLQFLDSFTGVGSLGPFMLLAVFFCAGPKIRQVRAFISYPFVVAMALLTTWVMLFFEDATRTFFHGALMLDIAYWEVNRYALPCAGVGALLGLGLRHLFHWGRDRWLNR